ncbi:hypothetical protein BGZ58_004669, partial [Dissophora ornata]
MGVTGFYQALKKRGLDPAPSDIQECKNKLVDIDLFGSFYGWLVGQITGDYGPTKVAKVSHAVAARLANDFTPVQCTIRIDGAPSVQKQKAHIERKNSRAASFRALEANLKAMGTKSANGQWTSQSLMRKIQNGLHNVFRFESADKNTMRDIFREKGFQVCECKTEADVCIARTLAGSSPDLLVVSADSDLLIYQQVAGVLRPIIRGSS